MQNLRPGSVVGAGGRAWGGLPKGAASRLLPCCTLVPG